MNSQQIRARQIATDVLMENLDDDWAKPPTITDSMVEEAVRRINPELFTRRRSGERVQVSRRVREWMGNQSEHDGYADQVAVDRAVELRFEAWAVLTDVERSMAVRALAAMSNPWGVEGADVFSEDASMRIRNSAFTGPATLRAERFAQWPPAERSRLRSTVGGRRSREAAAAVAA